jgi:hypothetical protein
MEYRQCTHPPSGETTAKCNAEGEDPTPRREPCAHESSSFIILTSNPGRLMSIHSISNDGILLLRAIRSIEPMSGIDFILESLRLSLIRFRQNDDEAELFVKGNSYTTSCPLLWNDEWEGYWFGVPVIYYHTDIEL